MATIHNDLKNMKNAKEELERVNGIHSRVGSDFVTSRDYKNDREWWVLGHVITLLEKAGHAYPEYAIKTNPPEPDFVTYSDNKTVFRPMEIGEVLAPDRRRGDEYSTPCSIMGVNQLDEPWKSFILLLRNKFLRRYGNNCWLVVYHDILCYEISLYNPWHEVLLASAANWNTSSLIDLGNSPYEKILVLNSNGNALVEIFPSLSIIVPDLP